MGGANGVITTNGEPRDLHQFRKLSRYIMQQDLLQPYITVLEAMTMAADLKLGSDLDKRQKATVVSNILCLHFTIDHSKVDIFICHNVPH